MSCCAHLRTSWICLFSWPPLAAILNSAMVGPCSPLMLFSVCVSCGRGSGTGCCESASGALLDFPFLHSAVKLYPIRWLLRHCNLGFLISSSRCEFRIRMRGWWEDDEMTLKCGSPARNILHLVTAHDIASAPALWQRTGICICEEVWPCLYQGPWLVWLLLLKDKPKTLPAGIST